MTSRIRNNVREYNAEDQALSAIANEAENRLAEKRAARAEAREIRTKEIERRQKEAEERESSQSSDNGIIRAVRSKPLSAAVPPPSSGASAQDSDDSSEADSLSSRSRELRLELKGLEEKYKAAMVSSAQLDNERQSLVYQVDLLKDQLEEHTEALTELHRQYKDKNRDCEMTKRELLAAQHELKGLREQNDCKDRLISESGMVIVAAEDGELGLERSSEVTSANGPIGAGGLLLSSEALDLLNGETQGSLDDKVKALAGEKKKLIDEVKRLEGLLNDAQSNKTANSSDLQVNGPDMQLYEIERDAKKQIHDYKFKLQKAEQDIATLEGTVSRLESQVKRYRSDAERAESMEDELKQEKRKLQRELREALTEMEELANQNKHLTIRLDRIKQSRTALGIQ